jgi:hypothetical protein
MAVIDHDNFSNISWQSGSNTPVAESSAPMPNIEAEPPTHEDQQHGEDLEHQDPGLSGDILECSVSEPRKESDGTKDAFVSYLITTSVRCPYEPVTWIEAALTCILYLVHLPFIPETDIHLPPPLYRLCISVQDPI